MQPQDMLCFDLDINAFAPLTAFPYCVLALSLWSPFSLHKCTVQTAAAKYLPK